MKLSEKWIRQWVNPNKSIQEIASDLTMAGLEVDAVLPVANNIKGVVIGEVLEVKPHPDAERLRVCQVNVGEASSLSIVCGASNVRKGLKVAVALIGAVLSPELIIKKAKLRGVESSGMLCSTTELGLAEKSDGIMELPKDAPIGQDISSYLQLDDHIFDLKITPNRGDCLSVLGIAREVAVINKKTLTPPNIKPISKVIADTFPVEVQASKACPHYVGRLIRNINSQATTPIWMQERLRRSGIRSIHPIVDVTNYVMLELGQPLHAFDLHNLTEKIIVRFAKPKERIKLLDEKELELNADTLIIADAKQPQAIGGVMGGLYSGVSESTVDIFLESAYFAPLTVANSVQRYNLQSDSSQRFERGVDPQLQNHALERATELILNIAGGSPGPVIEKIDQTQLPKNKPILLRQSRIKRILGISIPDQEVKNILTRLGMQVTSHQQNWEVIPPSYRFDLQSEIDLMEELARIYGFNQIPVLLPTAELKTKPLPKAHIPTTRIKNLLVDRAYHEIISYSFVPTKLQKLLDPENPAIELANPISTDMDVMRTSLWPGLIQAALYNQHRQENRIRLFETGLCFIEKGGQIEQPAKLGGIASGSVFPEQWGIPKNPLDFFDVKNDIEAILALTKNQEYTYKPSTHPALHPHQSAEIFFKDRPIGRIGALHPDIEKEVEIQSPIYLFELDLSIIQKGEVPIFSPVSKFPMIRRDIALVLDQFVPVSEIKEKIFNSANELLKNVQIFDIYQGKGIDLGKKSVALGLIFQHPTRTLLDSEINEQVNKIVTALEKEFGAKLRE